MNTSSAGRRHRRRQQRHRQDQHRAGAGLVRLPAGNGRWASPPPFTAAALVHEMMEASDEKRLLNLHRQLSRLNMLIIDELGFVPLCPAGAELLFEVLS